MPQFDSRHQKVVCKCQPHDAATATDPLTLIELYPLEGPTLQTRIEVDLHLQRVGRYAMAAQLKTYRAILASFFRDKDEAVAFMDPLDAEHYQ